VSRQKVSITPDGKGFVIKPEKPPGGSYLPRLLLTVSAMLVAVVVLVLLHLNSQRTVEPEAPQGSTPRQTVTPPTHPESVVKEDKVSPELQIPATAISTAEKVYEQLKSATVRVCVTKEGRTISRSTGFVLDPGDMVVTNPRVVASGEVEIVTFCGRTAKTNKGFLLDWERNIALVRLPNELRDRVEPLKLAQRPPRLGEEVFGLGRSSNRPELALKRAEVERCSQNPVTGLSVIQTYSPTRHRSVGGPLLNSRGRVVGIICLGIRAARDKRNLDFALVASEIAGVVSSRPESERLLSDLAFESFIKRLKKARAQKDREAQISLLQQVLTVKPNDNEYRLELANVLAAHALYLQCQ